MALSDEILSLRMEPDGSEWVRGFNAGLDAAVDQLPDKDAMQEISDVLNAMDVLAEVWGDEAVFRRCRDRLRKVVQGK